MPRTMAESATKLTYADYLQFPDDGNRHELIDGEHFVTPSPNLRHQRILRNLFRVLDTFVDAQRVGQVYFAPLDVILSDVDVVEPDLLFIGNERLEQLDNYVKGPPDLAVEILSPSTHRKDEVRKRDLFERAAVPEYWIVDPDPETVKVYRRVGDVFSRPELLSRRDGDVLRSPLFPGLEIPLATIFAP